MSLDTAEKQKLIETHQVHATDTGSVEVQVAMLSKRISKLAKAVFSDKFFFFLLSIFFLDCFFFINGNHPLIPIFLTNS